jgi:hypothetical protein
MRRRRLVVSIVAVLAVAWVSAGVLHGITYGRPDGNDHPYVGFVVFFAPAMPGGEPVPRWYCTGALVSPTVVLTAGHCTDGASFAMVSFNSDIRNPPWYPSAIRGTAYTHPDFDWTWQQGLLGWKGVDTGVVVLDSPVMDKGFAELPEAGLSDTLKMGTAIDVVGYGVQFKEHVSGPPYDRWNWTGQRYSGLSQIVASNNRGSDMWLKLSANPGQGKGGICFGDSGGPDLLGGTNVIVATNSFVPNTNCAGLDYSNRVDRTVVLEWVNGFLQ